MASVKSQFWERQGVPLSGDDVVVRFKQWMSDDDWRPEIFRHLPMSVIKDAAALVSEGSWV